jgi:hypothetical protein
MLANPNSETKQMAKMNYSRNHSRYMGTLVSEYLGTEYLGTTACDSSDGSVRSDPGQPGKMGKSGPAGRRQKRRPGSRKVRLVAREAEADAKRVEDLRRLNKKFLNGQISESAYRALKRKIIKSAQRKINEVTEGSKSKRKGNSRPKIKKRVSMATGRDTTGKTPNSAKQGKPKTARPKAAK